MPATTVESSAGTACVPTDKPVLTPTQAADLAAWLKVMADPCRLRLLSIMISNEDLQACTCDLVEPLGISQPTISHHLRKLSEAGLVTHSKRGTRTYYRVIPEAIQAVAGILAVWH